MKQLIILVLFSGFSLMAKAADTEKPVKSSIKEVTVFQKGAEITRTGNYTLNSGIFLLLFEGLSPKIDKNSIQVKGKGNFTIMSVLHRINYLKESDKTPMIVSLEDSLKSLKLQIDEQKDLQKVYSEEEAMLLANKSIGNKDIGVDALDLEEMADFFRKRLKDIKSRILQSKTEETELREETTKLKRQLATLNAKRNRATGEIVVTVSAKERTPARFTLSYFVPNAGWIPSYDLRASDTKTPVQLDYKAKVYQNTGVDWNDVLITLATANPTRSGTKPVMRPWVLRYYEPVTYKAEAEYDKRPVSRGAMAIQQVLVAEDTDEGVFEAATTAEYTKVTENQVNAEFKISLPYSIPADGKRHTVNIQNYKLPATYVYYCIPKKDPDAFLLAKVTGWEEHNLLSGEASIFFEGTFIGNSNINANNTDDTLDLSFGRDKKVVVTREKMKDFMSKKLIGTNRKETFAYEINIRNTKKDPVEIILDRKSTRLNSSHIPLSRMPSSA